MAFEQNDVTTLTKSRAVAVAKTSFQGAVFFGCQGDNFDLGHRKPKSNLFVADYLSSKTIDFIAQSIEENYFASQLEPSPLRAIANLRESAWWSSQLVSTVIWICAIVIGLLLGGSILTLSYSISSITNLNSLASTNRVVTALLSLVVTLGFTKLISGYVSFKLKSDQVEQSCNDLLKAENVKDIEAIRLLHEYQLSRASAPLIPDIVWQKREKKLNVLWKKYETDN